MLEQLVIDELDQIFARQSLFVIELALGIPRRGPRLPAILSFDDWAILSPLQFGDVGAAGFEVVQVFQEQDPGRLFGIVLFGRDPPAPCVGPGRYC
jgi:hypothetical protein